MSEAKRPLPTVEEIRQMMERAAAIYCLGGPPVDPANEEIRWDEDEWHGLVLCGLANAPGEHDPAWFAAFLREHRLENAVGMRTLLRLSASYAIAVAWGWVLQEGFDVGSCGGHLIDGPFPADYVEEEASGLPGWAFESWYTNSDTFDG